MTPSELRTTYVADVQYVGQSSELGIGLADLDGALDKLIESRFAEAYAQLYGRPGAGPIEIVGVRAAVFAPVRRARYRALASSSMLSSSTSRPERRTLYFGPIVGLRSADIYAGRESLANRVIEGPAVIEEIDTTVLVPPGSSAHLDEAGNVLVDLDQTTGRMSEK